MRDFKVGDRVKIKRCQHSDREMLDIMGLTATIIGECSNYSGYYYIDIGGRNWEWHAGYWFDKIVNNWERIEI